MKKEIKNEDIENSIITILQRMKEKLVVQYDLNQLAEWAPNYNSETGLFDDLDYPTKSPVPNDQNPLLYKHLDRLKAFASASYYLDEVNKELKQFYEKIAFDGIVQFVNKNYSMHNWYYTTIGHPEKISIAMLWLEKMDLSTKFDLWENTVLNLREDGGLTDYNVEHQSGANLADIAYHQSIFTASTLWHCLQQEKEYTLYDSWMKDVQKVYQNLIQVLNRDKEGIQSDYSFTQHNEPVEGYPGAQLYSNHYGQNYIKDVVIGFSFLIDTLYSLQSQYMDLLVDVIVNGYGVMGYKNWLDYNAEGRCVTYGTIGFENAIKECVETLIPYDIPHKEAMLELQKRCNGDEKENSFYFGNFHYYCTDYHACYFKDWFCGLKTVSKRTVGSESGNDQGKKNYFMGQGTHFFIKKGDEYRDIQPIWNWKRLPGTTVEQDHQPLPLIEWGYNSWGTDDRAGGVAKKHLGTSSMVWSRLNVKNVYKSHFFFENTLLVMASHMDTTSTEYDTISTIDQTLYQGDVEIVRKRFVGKLEEYQVQKVGKDDGVYGKNIVKIVHNGIVYDFENPHLEQEVYVEVKKQTGNWNEINYAKSGNCEAYVLTIYILHKQANNEKLYYKISSHNQHQTQLNTIVSNAIHWAQNKKTMESTFTTFIDDAGWINLGTTDIRFEQPITGASSWINHDTLEISVSDLTQLKDEICMEIKGNWSCSNTTTHYSPYTESTSVIYSTPQNNEKGKAILLTLHKV